ncbi:MAG: flagellar basal body-associated FliL family protein [Rhodospirillales bacterium]
MASPRENPIMVLGFFLALALLAWGAVYAYVYLYLPHEHAEEVAAQPFDANDPPIRVAYQPMPWPDLQPGGNRIELQVHIQPYENDNVGLMCERMPQVKDVINLVLSQFDDEEVAVNLDLAMVEEHLANALNERFGEPLIRGTFIDLGTTSGNYERYRLYCRAPGEPGAGGAIASGSSSLENWFVRAAKSRQRRVEKLRRERELLGLEPQ